LAGSYLRSGPAKTPRELDPEKPNGLSMVRRFAPLSAPREILNSFNRIIWVEPREITLAPVGECFLLITNYQADRVGIPVDYRIIIYPKEDEDGRKI